MTSPPMVARGEVPTGIVKQQMERWETLLVRLEKQAESIRRIRMRYLGQEPEPDGPNDKLDLPPDLHSRMQQNVNELEEYLNRVEVDLERFDNAY